MSARDLAVTAAMDEDTHGDLKEIQRSCAKSAESIFGMAAKRLSSSGGMGGARSANWGGVDSESVDCVIAGVCFRNCDVPCWPKCVGWRMKAITEQDRIAARALAKRLVKELGAMEWHRRGNESECAQRVAEAVNREARNSGLNPLLIKSFMLRLQRGDV